jgi:hypothetical protein
MSRIASLVILLLIGQTGIATTVPQESIVQSSSRTADSVSQEVYAGQAVGRDTEGDLIEGDLSDQTTPFTLELKGHTSTQEIEEYARILQSEGQQGLFQALNKKTLGYFRLDGQPERVVIFAQQTQDQTGVRTVRILCERWLDRFVVGFEDRAPDFPFAYVELSLDQGGKREGTLFMAASVKFNNRTARVSALNDHAAMIAISDHGPTTIGVEDYANNADWLREVRLKSSGPMQQ